MDKKPNPKVNHSGRVLPTKLSIRQKIRERKNKKNKPYKKRGY